MVFYLSNKNKTNIEGLSNRPKHGIHGANWFAPFPFPLTCSTIRLHS